MHNSFAPVLNHHTVARILVGVFIIHRCTFIFRLITQFWVPVQLILHRYINREMGSGGHKEMSSILSMSYVAGLPPGVAGCDSG